jgi:toxin CptA
MENNNMKSIQLNIKPSIKTCCLFSLLGTGALSIVLLLVFSWQLKLALSLMIIASTTYTVLNHGLRILPWSFVGIMISAKGQVQFTQNNGESLDITILADTVVTTYLTVLNGYCKEASLIRRLFPHSIIIFSDAVEAESYRQVRVYLRWSPVGRASSQQSA